MTSFDLRREPWAPVSTAAGQELVSLRELFLRAHEFTDLTVPVPPAKSGGLRILYALTARITGLDNPSGWTDRRLEVLAAGAFDPAVVEAYFSAYADRFDLFDQHRPWLQDPRLATECAKSAGVNKLVFDRPSGQNQVWFAHHTDGVPVAVDSAEAVWYLIAQLYYGASGRCSTRRVDGQEFANTSAGPLRSAVSYHPVGSNLFQTLVLGVPDPDGADSEPGDCPWEQPALPDPFTPVAAVRPLQVLTGPFQHAILLVPDQTGRVVADAYLTWATRAKTERPHDPYVLRLRNRKENTWYRRQAQGDRALWQDVEALVADRPNSTRPPVLRDCDELRFADDLTVQAFGFDQDGQAKDRQWFTGATPPILRWRERKDPVAAGGIETIHTAAEIFGRRLDAGLKDAWKELAAVGGRNAPAGPWMQEGTSFYWARAEQVFWDHVERRAYDDASFAFLRLARDSIEHVMPEQPTPRLAKAAATARRRLVSASPKEGA
jgi:CRISPR system Cascade subunit CasA